MASTMPRYKSYAYTVNIASDHHVRRLAKRRVNTVLCNILQGLHVVQAATADDAYRNFLHSMGIH